MNENEKKHDIIIFVIINLVFIVVVGRWFITVCMLMLTIRRCPVSMLSTTEVISIWFDMRETGYWGIFSIQ